MPGCWSVGTRKTHPPLSQGRGNLIKHPFFSLRLYVSCPLNQGRDTCFLKRPLMGHSTLSSLPATGGLLLPPAKRHALHVLPQGREGHRMHLQVRGVPGRLGQPAAMRAHQGRKEGRGGNWPLGERWPWKSKTRCDLDQHFFMYSEE